MNPMFFYEGYICPVCKQKFDVSHDIVACPECGAPHHRDCWMQEGHCKYSDDHGTSSQWKRPEDTSSSSQQNPSPASQGVPVSGQVHTCSRCGKINPEYAEFCARCGTALKPPDWNSTSGPAQNAGGQQYGGAPYTGGYGEYTPFRMPIMDPYGGVAHDENIDGVSAEDLVAFVGPNSAYYLPRFYKMARNGTRSSWNWVAFLFTPYWLLYRKNYLAGSIILILTLISNIINNYIYTVFIFPKIDGISESEIYSLFRGGSFTIYLLIVFLLFFVSLLIRIIFGIIGNSLYQRTAVSRIKRIGEKTGMNRVTAVDAQNTSVVADYRQELTVNGGVSLILVAVANGIVLFGQMLYQAIAFL